MSKHSGRKVALSKYEHQLWSVSVCAVVFADDDDDDDDEDDDEDDVVVVVVLL